jgi:hypothetical protein
MQEAQQYDAIRRKVEQRFQQRNAFYTHLAVYTLVSILLWLIYGFTAGLAGQFINVPVLGLLLPIVSFPWPLIVMAGWGIGLVAHGLNYYSRYGEGAIRRQEAIQREIERELALDPNYEKPKNDSYVRLTDDGELEVIEDDSNWQMKRKRQ